MMIDTDSLYTTYIVDNYTEYQQLLAVNKNAYIIQYIENPSEKVQFAVIEQQLNNFRFINNPSIRVLKYVLPKLFKIKINEIKNVKNKYSINLEKILINCSFVLNEFKHDDLFFNIIKYCNDNNFKYYIYYESILNMDICFINKEDYLLFKLRI